MTCLHQRHQIISWWHTHEQSFTIWLTPTWMKSLQSLKTLQWAKLCDFDIEADDYASQRYLQKSLLLCKLVPLGACILVLGSNYIALFISLRTGCGGTIHVDSQNNCWNALHEYDDVIKWKHFPIYWPFLRGIHRRPVNSPHKVQRRGSLMFSLICARTNNLVNNRDAGDLRRHHAHYDVIVIIL